MGIHICLYKGYEDHPDWDYIRQANDRQFSDLIDWNKVEYDPNNDDHFRPTNFTELKEKINETDFANKKRYLHLLELMEKDKDYYLYFSY